MLISGWGAFPRAETRLISPRAPQDLAAALPPGAFIPRGAGRAYGDAAIGREATVSTLNLDRMISFDPATGLLVTEAGVRLADIIEAFLPLGFFPPVVPGTKQVTVGGMIASHIHGKNHHLAGGFGGTLENLVLLCPDGQTRTCSSSENPDLFTATIGGMGLTGVIVQATLRLAAVETAYIRQRTVVARDLDAALDAFDRYASWTYAVAWIDTLARGAHLGRSLVYLGEHAKVSELPPQLREAPLKAAVRPTLTVPFDAPNGLLNRLTVSGMNFGYFNLGARREGEQIVPINPYFFPLDSVGDWFHVYGRQGFVQHQCVIPKARSREALGEILDLVARRGSPSFLAVLKLMGPDEAGLMAFPMEGYTLALDFPATSQTFNLLGDLDRCVARMGGRLYLAKDARQSPFMLEAGYPNLARFRDLRVQTGAAARLSSLQSERLCL